MNAVVDLDDLHVLDLDTMAWLPFSFPFPRCRGGTNAVVQTPKGWLLSGGMVQNNHYIYSINNELLMLSCVFLFFLAFGDCSAYTALYQRPRVHQAQHQWM